MGSSNIGFDSLIVVPFSFAVYESPDVVLDPLRQASDELELLEVNILMNLNL